MKKLLNDPLVLMKCWWGCAAHLVYRQTGEGGRVITLLGRKDWEGWYRLKGGSGHLPVFTGYVGHGLLDACAIGDVSPSVEQMAEAMKVLMQVLGITSLRKLWWNVMNFDMAGEQLDMEEDIQSTTVLLADDVSSAPPEEAGKAGELQEWFTLSKSQERS